MVRRADNDFDALCIAQGMENAGATVFSITHNGMHKPLGAIDPSSRLFVWAKVEYDWQINEVDHAIDKERNKTNCPAK